LVLEDPRGQELSSMTTTLFYVTLNCRCKLYCWWLISELDVLQKVWPSTMVVHCK